MCGWYAQEIDNGRKNKRDIPKVAKPLYKRSTKPIQLP